MQAAVPEKPHRRPQPMPLDNRTQQCSATAKSTGRRCQNPAVAGFSVCRVHGAGTPSRGTRGGRPPTHGRYSRFKRESLRELIDDFADDPEPLDVLPELATIRALLTDYVNQYAETVDALHAWNRAYASGEKAEKPQRLPELHEAIRFLDTVTKAAHREKRLRQDDAVTRKDLGRILTEMTRALDSHVTSDAERARVKEAWDRIHLA